MYCLVELRQVYWRYVTGSGGSLSPDVGICSELLFRFDCVMRYVVIFVFAHKPVVIFVLTTFLGTPKPVVNPVDGEAEQQQRRSNHGSLLHVVRAHELVKPAEVTRFLVRAVVVRATAFRILRVDVFRALQRLHAESGCDAGAVTIVLNTPLARLDITESVYVAWEVDGIRLQRRSKGGHSQTSGVDDEACWRFVKNTAHTRFGFVIRPVHSDTLGKCGRCGRFRHRGKQRKGDLLELKVLETTVQLTDFVVPLRIKVDIDISS
ncbi:ATP-dependent protease, putative [Babesia ovata]|uniref:ATP-dependent protease, putative n=1 Tax=Babesia ovata TaxID=189622 RepID=A0A2H6KB44_9APIC|nr:ATP-dependent protease, putative [Babesia ovata]GBE60214.1 ATP-dependent protease, putative [Babesia ovata]